MSQIFYTRNPLISKIQITYDNKPEEKSYSSNIRDTVIEKWVYCERAWSEKLTIRCLVHEIIH